MDARFLFSRLVRQGFCNVKYHFVLNNYILEFWLQVSINAPKFILFGLSRSLVWKWNHMLHFIPMVPISYNRKVKVKTTEVRENHTYTVTCSITWVSSEQLMKYTYMQWIHCLGIFSMANSKTQCKINWNEFIAEKIEQVLINYLLHSNYFVLLQDTVDFLTHSLYVLYVRYIYM